MLRSLASPLIASLGIIFLSAPLAQAQAPPSRDALRAALAGGASASAPAEAGAAQPRAPVSAGALNALTQGAPRQLQTIAPTISAPLLKGSARVMVHARCGAHVLLSTVAKDGQGIRPLSTYALELRTGRTYPMRGGELGSSSCVGDDIVAGTSLGPAVFRAAEARWEAPALSVAGGDTLREVTLLPIGGEGGEASGDFLVRATSASAQVGLFYYGIWRPGDATLALKAQDFHYATAASYAGDRLRVVASTRRAEGAQARSTPALFELSASGVKLAHHGEAQLLAGGWAIVTRDAAHLLVAPDGSARRIDTSQCRPHRQQVFTASKWAAALVRCVDATDNARDHFIAWSPARTLRWSLTRDYAEGMRVEMPLYPDSPLSTTTERDARFEGRRWFDLRAGVAWQGEGLIPLNSWSSIRDARVLVSDTPSREGAGQRQRIALSLVDLDAGTAHALHQYDDCPGFLMVAEQRQGRAIVQCVLKPTPGKWDFFARWSEVIDLEAGQRWRAPKGRALVTLLDEGGVLMSDHGPHQSLLHDLPSQLWAVQLPWGQRAQASRVSHEPAPLASDAQSAPPSAAQPASAQPF